jgi:hypothetical protein
MNKYLRSRYVGQTLVEFALILPIFIFLAVVIFDFGRAVYYYNAIHNAAREGARYGVIHPHTSDYDDIKDVAITYSIGLGLVRDDIIVEPGPPEDVAGEQNPTIKITVNYCFDPVTPYVEDLVKSSGGLCGSTNLLLTSVAVMRTEVRP